MDRYFVFVDETGNNDQEQFLGIGCLLVPVEKIGDYHERLKSKYGQIHTVVKEKERDLVSKLDVTDLRNFVKGRHSAYEMKFKNINPTSLEQYKWLITEYFKFSDVKFCCLVIDKQAHPVPHGMHYFDAYLNQLTMLLKNNVGDSEFILLPDDITVPSGKQYESALLEKLQARSKKCLGVHRLESHSSLFLQMVDILTGAVVYEIKSGTKYSKIEICKKIRDKLSIQSFASCKTQKSPNYFSVWMYQNKS